MKQTDNMQVFGTDDYEAVQEIYTDWSLGEKPIYSKKVKAKNRLAFEYGKEDKEKIELEDYED